MFSCENWNRDVDERGLWLRRILVGSVDLFKFLKQL